MFAGLKLILKLVLPKQFREGLILCRKYVRYKTRKYLLKLAINRGGHIKIIVGAAETSQKGWYATNEQWLDIANTHHWKAIFENKPMLQNVVAEHVFEHLTAVESSVALKNIYDHLAPNGKVRIAVPDGYNPNTEYIKHVEIGGIGDDAEDHKQLFNSDKLCELLNSAGFEVTLIEGYNKDGVLSQREWNESDGFILRSRQNETAKRWPFPDSETSLIVDGIKKL